MRHKGLLVVVMILLLSTDDSMVAPRIYTGVSMLIFHTSNDVEKVGMGEEDRWAKGEMAALCGEGWLMERVVNGLADLVQISKFRGCFVASGNARWTDC